jgi:amino acid adenylation domain-containing protein
MRRRRVSGKADRDLLKEALVRIRGLKAELHAQQHAASEPIAIVGIGCRFPGGADTPDRYWHLLRDGVDAIGAIPESRWHRDAYYDPDPETPGTSYVREGGFLPEIAGFDAEFFGIAPREAVRLDPQQRLLLEVSWEALEHAGLAPARLTDRTMGIYVGAMSTDYAHRQAHHLEPRDIDPYMLAGNDLSFAAGRLAYFLGVHGPAMVVSTACSSSLVAVHLAAQAIRAGECDLALAGGVNLVLDPTTHVMLSKLRALAKDGRCKTFDARADGYGRGEGCGLILLERLSDARAQGHRVLAVIRGSAVNHDGPSAGLTVPNGLAQEALLRRAFAAARIAPSDLDYVEAHGTGTALGDPIELHALARAIGPRTQPLRIGSVKTNIGHLEPAAGIAGLIKVALAMQHRQLPPHLHFETPSPHVDWEALPLAVVTRLENWHPSGTRRLAGISSFGLSGVNAHIVLEEAPDAAIDVVKPDAGRSAAWTGAPGTSPSASRTTAAPTAAAGGPQTEDLGGLAEPHVLTISARTPDGLDQQLARYDDWLAGHSDLRWADVCFTANIGRTHFAHRVAIVATSASDARERLQALRHDDDRQTRAAAARPAVASPAVTRAAGPASAPASGSMSTSADEQRRDTPALNRLALLEAIAASYISGAEIDWLTVVTDRSQQPRQRVTLPTYPFQRQPYWALDNDTPQGIVAAGNGDAPAHKRAGANADTSAGAHTGAIAQDPESATAASHAGAMAEAGQDDAARERARVVAAADDDQRRAAVLDVLDRQARIVLGLQPTAAPLDRERSLLTLGLDSLMSLELRDRLHDRLGVEPTLAQLLSGATLTEIAALLIRSIPERIGSVTTDSVDTDRPVAQDTARHAGSSAIPPDVSTAQPITSSIAPPATAVIPHVAAPAASVVTMPLSYGQQALWFIHQSHPASAAYNVGVALHVSGEIDVDAMRRAFQGVVDRHASLRSVFAMAGDEPCQRVLPVQEVSFTQVDGTVWTDAQLSARVHDDYRQPFDLERGPLLRVHLYRSAAHAHVLLLTMHHLVCDAQSCGTLLEEWQTRYAAERSGPRVAPSPADHAGARVAPSPVGHTDARGPSSPAGHTDARVVLPPANDTDARGPLPLANHIGTHADYAAFVAWQRDLIAGPEGDRQLAFWRRQLAGDLPALDLPTDRPRPPVQTYNGASHAIRVPAALAAELGELSRAQHATLFVTLLAAFHVLLHRYTGQPDIAIASATSGRPAGFAGTIGYFVNPVVMRADLSGDPDFASFLRQVRQTALDAIEHQHLPFPLLVERLHPRRDPSRPPIVQADFSLAQVPRAFRGQPATDRRHTSAPHAGEATIATVASPQSGAPSEVSHLDAAATVTVPAQIGGPFTLSRRDDALASAPTPPGTDSPFVLSHIDATTTATASAPAQIGGPVTLSRFDLAEEEGQFDIGLHVIEDADRLQAMFKYNTDLFDRATIERMAASFVVLLEAIVANPDERLGALRLLPALARQQLIAMGAGPRIDYPQAFAHRLFEAQAARTPESIAVEMWRDAAAGAVPQLTYRELNDRADRLAHVLRRRGVVPDQLVGVCLRPSPDLVVALLAVLKAGGAYLPLDPAYPAERLSFMIRDSGMRTLITTHALRDRLPDLAERTEAAGHGASPLWIDDLPLDAKSPSSAMPDASTLEAIAPVAIAAAPATAAAGAADAAASHAALTANHLAYVIYTSGSTGTPKGAMITHRGLGNYLSWCLDAYRMQEGCGAPVNSSIAFDATITSFFAPLLAGGTVTLLPDDSVIESLAALLRTPRRFSLVKITPAHLDVLAQQLATDPGAGRVNAFVIGGEALRGDMLAWWQRIAPDTRLINEYGPTETVVGCCVYDAPGPIDGAVPIGRPIANTQLYVLDERREPVPLGVIGELYIGGAGVARGYVNRPELTAARFVDDPFSSGPSSPGAFPSASWPFAPAGRLYRTGDLARWRPDGTLDYAGRNDAQVKIRGFRVEPGEIEAALASHPAIADSLVIAREIAATGLQLVAYIVPAGELIDTREIVDTGDIIDARDIVNADDIIDTRDIVNAADIVDTRGIVNAADRVDTRSLVNTADTADTVNAGDVVNAGNIVDSAGHIDTHDLIAPRGARRTAQPPIGHAGDHRADRHQHPEVARAGRWSEPGQDRLARVLRAHLAARLPEHMVPAAFVTLPAFPLTPNGKIDRAALPAPATASARRDLTSPRDALELSLAAVWAEVLGVSAIGIHDNFFDLGGHSLLAVRLMARVTRDLGHDAPLATILRGPTIAQMAQQLRLAGAAGSRSALVPINTSGTRPPFFCVPGAGGNPIYLQSLARHLGPDQPFYGLQGAGFDDEAPPHTRVEEMAAYYIDAIKAVAPDGPYHLGGHSLGGWVAFEMARQLRQQGHQVPVVAIIDTPAPFASDTRDREAWDDARWIAELSARIATLLAPDMRLTEETVRAHAAEAQLPFFRDTLVAAGLFPAEGDLTSLRRTLDVFKAHSRVSYSVDSDNNTGVGHTNRDDVSSDDGRLERIVLLRTGAPPSQTPWAPSDATWGWGRLAATEVYVVPGDHLAVLRAPHVVALAERLSACLTQALAVAALA